MRRVAFVVIAFLAATSAFAYENALWIPGWGSAQLNSIQLNAGALAESNPVWYGWNSDATLTKKSNAENPTWRAAMTGTRIIPTVQNTTSNGFDGTAVQTMLATAASREAHAGAIAQLVINQAFDGIDVDYENVPTASRANFTAFLTTLAGKLHAIGKKLSVSVYAKTSDGETWTGAGAEDWQAIGQVADSVKIMAYDYHWSTSAPGPIAPLTWLDQVAAYAESAIPAQKIMVGLPFYGYDWSGNNGTDVGYTQAIQTAQTNGATITHDANGEATYTYNGRTVYFQDATSYQKKIDLLKQKHPGIGGFTAWAAGQEDPNVWSIIKGAAVVGATPLPGDFTLSGPSAVTAFAGVRTTATYSLVPVNGFNASANVSAQAPASFNGSVSSSASSIGANGSVTLNINVTTSTAPGIYAIVVQFTSGSLVHTQTLNVSVVAAAPAVGPAQRAQSGRRPGEGRGRQ